MSLSAQLKRLSTPQNKLVQHDAKRVSILFLQSEVKNISMEFFYEIGQSGINELCTINAIFNKFNEFFGPTFMTAQRVIYSSDENLELNKKIDEFLLLVSPYLQKQASLKALEWLLQRFYINQMNIEALLMCIFPYYETTLFIRILQIIDFESSKYHWKWLEKLRMAGKSISKNVIYTQWANDDWFRKFFSKYLKKILKLNPGILHLKLAFSLVSSTEIGGLDEASQVSQDHVSNVYLTVLAALKCSHSYSTSVGLVLLSHLLVKAKLSNETLTELLKHVFQVSDPEVIKYASFCVLNIFYHNRSALIDPDILDLLYSNPAMLHQLSSISNQKTSTAFLTRFVEASFSYISRSPDQSERVSATLKSLFDVIESSQLYPEESVDLIRTLFHGLSNCSSILFSSGASVDVLALLRNLQSTHKEGFHLACSKIEILYNANSNEFKSEMKIVKKFRKRYIMGNNDSFKKLKLEDCQYMRASVGSPVTKLSKLDETYVNKILESSRLESLFSRYQNKDDVCDSFLNLIILLKTSVLNQIKKTRVSESRSIIKRIFKECCSDVRSQLCFLSFLWSWNSKIQGHIGVNSALKIWCLKAGHLLLGDCSSTRSARISWILDAKEPFVYSILSSTSGDLYVRSTAVAILKTVRHFMGARLRPNNLVEFVEEILKHEEEITSDSGFLPNVICQLDISGNGTPWKIIEKLLLAIEEDQIPLHLKGVILHTLSQVEHQEIMPRLTTLGFQLLEKASRLKGTETLDGPTSACLRFVLRRLSSDASNVFNSESGWELFNRSFALSAPVVRLSDKTVSPQHLVSNYKLLKDVTKSEKHIELIHLFITRIVKTSNVQEASALRKVLKEASLDTREVLALLDKIQLASKSRSFKEARLKKAIRKSSGEEGSSDVLASWRKVEVIVNLIGEMAEIRDAWRLVQPICAHLEVLSRLEDAFADTLQQQMLSVCYYLLEICSRELDNEEFVKKCTLNVSLFVQIIRSSLNPDTHRRALLILSLISKYFPNQVIHNFMAIFTFMSSSLRRRDDAYSFQVILQTISTVVPLLVQKSSGDPKSLIEKLSEISQVFIDSLPDVVEHRRLPVFMELALAFGARDFLWLPIVVLIDSYVAAGLTREEDSDDGESRKLPKQIKFAISLISQFSVIEQLNASLKVLNFVIDFPNNNDEMKKIDSSNLSIYVINAKIRTPLQIRQLKYTCLGLLVNLVSSDGFLAKVYDVNMENSDSEREEFKGICKDIQERALYFFKYSTELEMKTRGMPIAKFWTAILRKLMDLVDAVNAFLPSELLVDVISSLLLSRSEGVQCRAVEILSQKLLTDSSFIPVDDPKKFGALVKSLNRICADPESPDPNRQSAFFALQLFVRKFGTKLGPSVLQRILQVSTDVVRIGFPTKVVTQSALVAAEAVSVLQLDSLAHLDGFVGCVLSLMDEAARQQKLSAQNDNLVISLLTFLSKIIKFLPRMLSELDLEHLVATFCGIVHKCDGNENRIFLRLTSAWDLVIQGYELRILIPCISNSHKKILMDDVHLVSALFKIFEMVISNSPPPQLDAFKEKLIALFLNALNVRSQLVGEERDLVLRTELAILSAVKKFLMKMDEESNISILVLLRNWSSNSDESRLRKLATFFRLSSELASSLKTLFIKAKLAECVFDFAVLNLDKVKAMDSGADAASEESDVLHFIVSTLSSVFLYDSLNFTTEERFLALIEPLASQLENTYGSEEEYEERISTLIKPCFVRMTKVLPDDSQWKCVSRHVLQRLSVDHDSKVVMAALEVFDGLIECLGEEFLLAVLPDAIPCVVELLENTDSSVRAAVKALYLKMESVVGDILKVYLNV